MKTIPLSLLVLVALWTAPALAADCEVVRFDTSDGVSLEADWCAAKPGAPLVVLMHMIPPHHDRSNFPPEVRASWVRAGFSVLNVDRRGAGESKGDAKEAYTGPTAKLDVAAAVAFAKARGAGTENWACVGASNGTTACLDYAIHAAAAEGATPPKALVYMTGGSYTEAQNSISKSIAASIPSLFTFNAKERGWSEGVRGTATAGEWRSYAPGGHGTRVFGANPEAAADIAAFLKKHLH